MSRVIAHRLPPDGGWLLALGLLCVCVGCESKAPGSLPRARLDAPPSAPPPAEVPTFCLIVPKATMMEAVVWEQTLRHDAAREGVLSEVIQSESGQQPEAIRDAVQRGVSALIIRPDDGPEVASALAEARDQGVPIVLLNHTSPVEGKPLPLVAFTPVQDSARSLVAAAVEEAKAVGYPAEGPAILLVNGPYDEAGRERVAALRQAIKEANVTLLREVVFEGFQQAARDALEPVLKEHPETAMVIADEDQGSRMAALLHHERIDDPKRFVVAGYCTSRETVMMAEFNLTAGVVDRNLGTLAHKAFEVARSLVKGETVPEFTEVPTPILRAKGAEKKGYFAELPPGVTSKTGDVPSIPFAVPRDEPPAAEPKTP